MVWHTPFTRDRECQHALDTVKRALSNAAVVAPLDPKAKYSLCIDGSQHPLGAVLAQVQEKAEKVLGYFSGTLHLVEMRYPSSDRELLGI